jgi:hypothetical protein
MELSAIAESVVTQLQTAALWYAWGQIDAGIGAPGDEFVFADSYREAARACKAGETFFLPSVQGAWREFLAARTANPTV